MIKSIITFFYVSFIIVYVLSILLIFLPFFGISIITDYLLYNKNNKRTKKKELDEWEQ
jgi:uncharacterized membrane protein YesL